MKGGRHMEWLFVLFFVIGALGIQLGNGWLAKSGAITPVSFLTVLPLLVIAQYFIASGYQEGAASFDFVKAHIIWTAVLIVATLAVNYMLFQTVPNALTLFALILAAAAAVIAVLPAK